MTHRDGRTQSRQDSAYAALQVWGQLPALLG